MHNRKLTSLAFILSLAGGLHLTFSHLSSELTTLYPGTAQEIAKPLPPPVLASTLGDIDPQTASLETDPAPDVLPEPGSPLAAKAAVPKSAPHETVGKKDRHAATREILDNAVEETLTHRKSKQALEKKELAGLIRVSPIPAPLARGAGPHSDFSVPPSIAKAVEFWQKIYGVYDTKQVTFHDEENLGIQYSVLDMRQGLGNLSSDAAKKSYRNAAVNQEMNRIKSVLTQLDQWEKSGGKLTEEQKRMASLFAGERGPNKFRIARDQVRSQIGLKDRFKEGLVNSGRYLSHFEKIFESYGVPKEISRLPFVESLFREKAFSKVAAAGIWQFMADTARNYMVVDTHVDERYDPLRSAHAAARLLLKNYQLLHSWPLAINAYNSGPGNLLGAISHLGTRDIGTIINHYRGGGYKFASRNFYPCFLAALGVYENRERFFGPVHMSPPLEFETVELPGTMTLPEVSFLARVSISDLKDLNPAFSSEVYDGKYRLPAGSALRLPTHHQETLAARFLEYHHPGSNSDTVMARETAVPTLPTLVR